MTHNNETCTSCQKQLIQNESVSYGNTESGYKHYCSECFNELIADKLDLDFNQIKFPEMKIKDAHGKFHKFKFTSIIVPTGIQMEATEIMKDDKPGYHFSILGSHEDGLLLIYNRLLKKMKKSMSFKHIEKRELGWGISNNHIVRGTIEYDEDVEGEVLGVVIDGQWFSWDDFGRMVNPYTGSRFKMVMLDFVEGEKY